MQTIILAGGFSTRLYPITQYFPKALLPIKGKAILGYILDSLIDSGIETGQISLISNNRYFFLFELWIRLNYPRQNITLLNDGSDDPDKRLGSIGDILFAIDKQKINDDILVLSSDTLTSIDFGKFMNFYKKHHGVVNALFDTHDKNIIANRLGCAQTEGDRIIEFIEKPDNPPTTITSVPFYIFPKETIPLMRIYIKTGLPADTPGSIIPWLMDRMPVFGHLVSDYYFDVGTIDIYNKLSAHGIN